MYHGTYVDPGNAPTDMPPILLDVRMFIIADKYFVESLKRLACLKFSARCEGDDWRSPDFATAVTELYESGVEDDSVRRVVVATIRDQATDLLMKAAEYPDIHKVMRETPAFGADVVVALTSVLSAVSGGSVERSHALSKLAEEYKQGFSCPECCATFSLYIPVGESISFGCPKGHHGGKSYTWWAKHRI